MEQYNKTCLLANGGTGNNNLDAKPVCNVVAWEDFPTEMEPTLDLARHG
jgi:hypothetical protein